MTAELSALIDEYNRTKLGLDSKTKTALEIRILNLATRQDMQTGKKDKTSINIFLNTHLGLVKGGESERRRVIYYHGALSNPLWELIDARKLTISTAKNFVQDAAKAPNPSERLQELLRLGTKALRKGSKKGFRSPPHEREVEEILKRRIETELKGVDGTAKTKALKWAAAMAHIFTLESTAMLQTFVKLHKNSSFDFMKIYGKRRDLVEHCRVLKMDVPPFGKPIDIDLVRKKARILAQLTHPDRQTGQSEEVRIDMGERQIRQNAALDFLIKYNASLAEKEKDNAKDTTV